MTAVQHVALNCRDVRAQEEFYGRCLGFRRSRVFQAGTPGEYVMLRLGATCLELFPATASGGREGAGGEQAVGFKHLAFEVDDLDEAVTALRDGGVRTGEIIDCSAVVEGLRICFLDDPEGNCLELMQGYTDAEA